MPKRYGNSIMSYLKNISIKRFNISIFFSYIKGFHPQLVRLVLTLVECYLEHNMPTYILQHCRVNKSQRQLCNPSNCIHFNDIVISSLYPPKCSLQTLTAVTITIFHNLSAHLRTIIPKCAMGRTSDNDTVVESSFISGPASSDAVLQFAIPH